MGRFTDKASILKAIRTEHEKLEGALAQIGEDQMLQPSFEGGWSAKDLLAHITFWEQRTLNRIKAGLRQSPPPKISGSVDAINARVFEENRDRPLSDVLRDFHQSYQDFVEQAEALTDEDLTDPHRFAWTRGKPLRGWLKADGYYHYAEHTRQIQAWLDSG